MKPLSDIEQVILQAIKQRPETDPYGNQINEEIEKIRGREMSFAVMHSALFAMEKAGLVKSRDGEATPERGGHKKLHYQLTELGKRALEHGKNY